MAEKSKYDKLKHELRAERKKLTLTSKPFSTLWLFTLEILHLCFDGLKWLMMQWLYLSVLFGIVGGLYAYLSTSDPELLEVIMYHAYEAGFWIFLGVLSSVGLGTGLHTFILYLGPYIAHVTLHAYHCQSTNFQPPFNSFERSTWTQVSCLEADTDEMTIWKVLARVRFPGIMWGLGTAIGELPPYFVARAARMSEDDLDDEDIEEFHASMNDESKQLSVRVKKFVHDLVRKAGFVGIFLCAAIPNPLFDLAGLTCGHFQIPFWTFFGATCLGKAIFKVHIQMIILISAMSKPVFEAILAQLRRVPSIGIILYDIVRDYQQQAQAKFASDDLPSEQEEGTNPLALVIAGAVILMIVGFLASIIGQLAQRHQHRRDRAKLEESLKSKDD